jgi:large subunit ribosomal protein L32
MRHDCSDRTRTEQEQTMAVPKRRTSRANTRSRRAQWKARRPDLVPITIDGESHLVPRRLVRAYATGLLRPGK